MRLELEQNPAHLGYAGDAAADTAVENQAAAANYLREGIRAAQSGNRAAARTSLLRAAELDPRNESAWMWLSSISEFPEELLAFLTNVLDINPSNARALEWSAATKSLLAKNLIQRGIDAAESNQNDLAAQHFNQALEYDEKNSMAWLWLASMCDSAEGKLTYLEKVLEFEPENETAKAGYQTAKNSIREGLLAEARAAAVGGDSDAANELLDAVIAEEPDAEDAWVLKSHIAVAFEEKIAAFRRVLEINPDNAVARVGLESLTSIMDAVGAAAQQNTPAPEPANTELEAEASTVVEAEVLPDRRWETENVSEEDTFETAAIFEAAETEPSAFEPEPETGSFEDENTPSPTVSFDDPVDSPVVDRNGTMLMTTSDLGFDLDDIVEVAEASVHSEPDCSPTDVTETDLSWTQGPDVEVPEEHLEEAEAQVSDVFNAEPEEITYELASETPETEVSDAEVGHEDDPSVSAIGSEVIDGSLGPVTEELAPEPKEIEDEAISAPGGNPFDTEAFRNEPSTYETVISAAPEAYHSPELPAPSPAEPPFEGTFFTVPFDSTHFAGTIPMPDTSIDPVEAETRTGFETRLSTPQDVAQVAVTTKACPFCKSENDAQAIACNTCLAVLTLADLELILANHHADKELLSKAVMEMESRKRNGQLDETELTTLGIGHLNLRNLQEGYDHLLQAAHLNPDNVVLSSQANALLIRIEEIRKQAEAQNGMVKGKTIVVVDDSPTVRKLIAGKLEKSGHEVHCCGDGVEAMDRLATLRPDLILLDITMPRMDGYQVCKLIRNDAATKDTPVVMISGKDGFFDKVRGRMAGCSGYITKPFGPETLMKAVESYLSPGA